MGRAVDLNQRLRAELVWDSGIDADDIQFEIDEGQGQVHLAGTVESYAAKVTAQEAALSLPEVNNVVNDIVVRPRPSMVRTDEHLRHMVGEVLSWDALVPEEDLVVMVSGGWVTLTGKVSVGAQRDEAERAVRHLLGVRGIDNNITVAPIELPPDQVRRSIEDALQRRALHSAAHLDITVEGHDVVLSGPVQSERERQAILGAVSHTPGIALVCDELELAVPKPD